MSNYIEQPAGAKLLGDLYENWDSFADVPVSKDGAIEAPFLHFGVGAERETIWRWFESQNPRFIVGDVMNGIRHEDERNLLQNTKVFDFKINQQRHPDGSVPEAQMISVAMTQEQFEDHQAKRDFVHDGIRAIGLNPAEVVWFESPPIDEVTERAFKEHIGAAPDAQLIAYYPHSVHHRHYKEATLNGVKFLYMSFQNGHFIKFAQSVSNLNSEQAPA